jgi:hypothetical protein
MKNIAAALVKAQKEFAPALKTSLNPHFKSKYVGLDGCVEAVIDALNNNGIYLMQKSHDCDDGVKVETILLHESGEEYSGGILHVPAAKNDPQGYGSALTYARRYSLMATCGIAPEDDDGNAATKAVKEQPKIDTKASEDILEVAAGFGTETLKKAWADLDETIRTALKDKLAGYKTMAAKNDNRTSD